MNHSVLCRAMAVGCLLSLWTVTGSAVGSDPDADVRLQVHLPREMTVEGNQLTLGQISVIRGPAPTAAQAREVRDRKSVV